MLLFFLIGFETLGTVTTLFQIFILNNKSLSSYVHTNFVHKLCIALIFDTKTLPAMNTSNTEIGIS
jgi:hypothetical protein